MGTYSRFRHFALVRKAFKQAPRREKNRTRSTSVCTAVGLASIGIGRPALRCLRVRRLSAAKAESGTRSAAVWLLFDHFDVEGDGDGVADHLVAAGKRVGHVDEAEILAIDLGSGGSAASRSHHLDDFGGAGDIE